MQYSRVLFFTIILSEIYLYSFLAAPGPPLPRPVLPRDRGYMDRVVEYLVGDGPNNRYALICRQCQSHNGMALKEEFEYIGRYLHRRARKFKKVQVKKLVKSNKPKKFFFVKLHLWLF